MNYKIILAIFLLIVMLCFDMNLNIEHFMSRFQNKQKQKPISNSYKKSVWVYYPKRDKCDLCDLCIGTIKDNLESVFKVYIFDDTDIKNLLPEYDLKTDLRFEILNEYGGLWIPNTCIVLKPFDLDEKQYTDGSLIILDKKIQTYTSNQNILNNNIFASQSNTKTLQKLLKNPKKTKGLNIINNNLLLVKMNDGRKINAKELFSTYQNNITLNNTHKIYYIDRRYINRFPKYKTLFTMSKKDILNSNYFIRGLIEYSQNKRKNLIFNKL